MHARKNGFFSNFSEKILVIGCPEPEVLSTLGFKDIVVCHPEKSVNKRAQEIKFQTLLDKDGIRKFNFAKSIETTFVWVTKSRRETMFNIALAFLATKKKGSIIVNGEKRDGVEYAIKELQKIVTPIAIMSKSHGKIGIFQRPLMLPRILHTWKVNGKSKKISPRYFSAAGVFSETTIDEGSRLLVEQFSGFLNGNVIDLGTGWGYLSAEAIRGNPKIDFITLIDSNLSALKSAKLNISSKKANFLWLDLQYEKLKLRNFDHVIMNAPFHVGREVNHNLWVTFLVTAKNALSKEGTLWMVFNRELPYKKHLPALFPTYEFLKQTKNYSVIRAKRTSFNQS